MTYREMQGCHGDGNNLQPNWQMAGHMVSVYGYLENPLDPRLKIKKKIEFVFLIGESMSGQCWLTFCAVERLVHNVYRLVAGATIYLL